MSELNRADASLPTGAVTFLFSDIEGSTRLWEEEPARMSTTLAWHDAVLRAAVEYHRGVVVKSTGDGVHAAFNNALDALSAAVDVQRSIIGAEAANGLPLHVRCGLHAGVVEHRDNDFFGAPVNRAARIMSAAHGGQVLLSQAVAESLREILPAAVSLRDLGRVRLKDLSTPEHVYQVVHPHLRQEFPALRSLETTPNNLPQQATSFIGRERAVAELQELLAKSRLLTLTGSGGCGKTRLCLQIAADSLERFPDGVWMVELAPLSDPDCVPAAVAVVLGLKQEPGTRIVETLTRYLRDKRLLLLLDNCEHVLAACAFLANSFVRQCPQLTILASSQEALAIDGEQTYRVPSLSLPDPEETHIPASVARSEAVQLFTDRARLARPDFQVTGENAPVLASICNRLDGVPLAIELAAARVRSLAVREISQRLDERFRLLNVGSRTALPRQQTLHAALEWSHSLLAANEQTLFRRLGVFAGGFTLELAQDVAADDRIDRWMVLDLLGHLVDKSLVVFVSDGFQRYQLLETMRAFALEQLAECKELDDARSRHAHAVSDFFSATDEQRYGERGTLTAAEFMQKLAPELDNFRAAFDWSVGPGSDVQMAITLTGAAALMLRWLGLSEEGVQRMHPLRGRLDDDVRTASQARFCFGLALMGEGGRLPESEVLELRQRESAFYEAQGPRRRMFEALYSLGWSLSALGEFDRTADILRRMHQMELPTDPPWLRATRLNLEGQLHLDREQFEAAVTVQTQQRTLLLQAPGEEILLINCQNNLCAALNGLGRFEEAIAVAQSSVDHAGTRNHGSIGLAFFQLLHAQLSLGRLNDAEQTVRKAMPGWKRDAVVLFGARHLAMLLAEQGRLEDAARVNGASTAYVRRSGSLQSPVRRQAYRRVMELFCAAGVDSGDVARWEREGETLDENAIAALCLRN